MQVGMANMNHGFNYQTAAITQSQSHIMRDGERPMQGGMDISAAGRMLSGMPQMASSTRLEMSEFGNAIKASLDSGSFDAAELAEQAPEVLKSAAEELGIDFTAMLEGIPAKLESASASSRVPGKGMGGMPGIGPMGGMKPMNGSGPMGGMPEPSEEMDSFLDEFIAAVEDGDVDTTTLAENAPEELQTMATNMGIDVATLVQDMASGIGQHGDPRENGHRPPPPPMNQQGMEAYATEMGNVQAQNTMAGLLGQFLDS